MRAKLRILRHRLRCRLTAVVRSQASGLSTRVNLDPAAYAPDERLLHEVLGLAGVADDPVELDDELAVRRGEDLRHVELAGAGPSWPTTSVSHSAIGPSSSRLFTRRPTRRPEGSIVARTSSPRRSPTQPGRRPDQLPQRPPATRSVVPVTYDAASLISQAIRVGDLGRLAGPTQRHQRTDPVEPAGLAGVGVDRGATMPGATPTTRMPSPATSCARPMVSASTPAFAAAYWTYSPGAPSVAAPEVTLTSDAARAAVRRLEQRGRRPGRPGARR